MGIEHGLVFERPLFFCCFLQFLNADLVSATGVWYISRQMMIKLDMDTLWVEIFKLVMRRNLFKLVKDLGGGGGQNPSHTLLTVWT